MEQICKRCINKIPQWVIRAERRFRRKYRGDTYHGIPINTKTTFEGSTYLYIVKYGDAIIMGQDPKITFYRCKR